MCEGVPAFVAGNGWAPSSVAESTVLDSVGSFAAVSGVGNTGCERT